MDHNQKPDGGVLEANESILKVSLPGIGGARLSRKFTEQEILKGDLKALASEFYEGCKAERDQA